MGKYVDLNFKVLAEFRREFGLLRAKWGVSGKQLLLDALACLALAKRPPSGQTEADVVRMLRDATDAPASPSAPTTDGPDDPGTKQFDGRHLSSAPKRPLAVLLIDADQVPSGMAEPLIEEIASCAQIIEVRVYKNFGSKTHSSWNNLVSRIGAIAIHTPEVSSGKNAADLELTADGISILRDGTADMFVIVSNDGDFAPLARRIVAAGKYALGVGTHQASQAFRAACSEFRFIGR